MFLRRLWYWLFPPEKSATAWLQFLQTEDEIAMRYPADHPDPTRRGQSRRGCTVRYRGDAAKLTLDKPKAAIVRFPNRKERVQ